MRMGLPVVDVDGGDLIFPVNFFQGAGINAFLQLFVGGQIRESTSSRASPSRYDTTTFTLQHILLR